MAKFKSCSGKLTLEHPISKAILERVSDSNGVFECGGARWMKESSMLLTASTAGAKILCKKHNESFSPYDTEMTKLFDALEKLKQFANNSTLEAFKIEIDGSKIVRWFAKAIIGNVIGNQAKPPSKTEPRLPDVLFDLLHYPKKVLPLGQGVYMSRSNAPFSSAPQVAIQLYSHQNSGRVLGAVVNLSGIEISFLLVNSKNIDKNLTNSKFDTLYPEFIAACIENRESRITFHWPTKHIGQPLQITKS